MWLVDNIDTLSSDQNDAVRYPRNIRGSIGLGGWQAQLELWYGTVVERHDAIDFYRWRGRRPADRFKWVRVARVGEECVIVSERSGDTDVTREVAPHIRQRQLSSAVITEMVILITRKREKTEGRRACFECTLLVAASQIPGRRGSNRK